MPVKIYELHLGGLPKESYVFRKRREEVRLDAFDSSGPYKFSVEYIPQEYARQSNFVAFSLPLVLSNDFHDSSKRGCRRYLRHVMRARDILEEGALTFSRNFPSSQIPLDDLVKIFSYELQRYN